ncbi:phosphatase PAP2 family protein [Streptomyces sp. SID5910]|uniref:phosphatase PAP2 family protein n=1 Tax=Streptomyces sp. SID5910 TaxID=2690312 RepID=UPI00136B6FFC|nr:phosphatase PAP2 family protein [Streptomyces sp. SID5910]MYR43954.1 phosphatase PAP2 family protein [Streptomyces sp. SID5910]
MNVEAELCRVERGPLRRVAAWRPGWVRRCVPVVEEAAERTKLWWGAALAMAAVGGTRGKQAALAGLSAMAVSEVLSNAVVKPLCERRRPPREFIPHDDVDDRPDSSSFPSGHTAAAFGFTTAVAVVWPAAGAVCALPAAAVAVQRVHAGAHYPSDVVAGAALGAIGAWSAHRLPRLLRRVIL